MTTAADPDPDRPRKAGKTPLILGLVMAVLGAGGGFFVVQSDLLAGGSDTTQAPNQPYARSAALTVGFVALDPLVISLPATNGRDHLRFSAQLEVPLTHVAEVEAIRPRIVDVLNGYLRAVDLADLENPAALARMRSQMLRRVQVVAGDDRVSDLLIMEFVLS